MMRETPLSEARLMMRMTRRRLSFAYGEAAGEER